MWGMKESRESKMNPGLPACSTGRVENNVLDRDGQRGMFGWKVKEFSLHHAEFQMAMGHPTGSVRGAVRDAELDSRHMSLPRFQGGKIQHCIEKIYQKIPFTL